MKKTFLMSAVLAIAVVGLMAGSAMATMFTLSSYGVNYNNSDPGLAVFVNPELDVWNWDLEVGDVITFELFEVGTYENSLDPLDVDPKEISVNLAFSLPAIVDETITGYTQGRVAFQDGIATWDSPAFFSFGNGGQFSVTLADVAFPLASGGEVPTPGSAIVEGTLNFISDSTPAPVPEPATMLLFGTGLAGLAGAARRKKAQKK